MSTVGQRTLVIGSEPYALAVGAVAACAGHAVTLANLEPTTAGAGISAAGGLHVAGLLKPGFVPLRVVDPNDLADAATTADLIVVATPLRAHRRFATVMAHARSTAGVLLVPGGVGGALAVATSVPSARFVAEVPGFPFLADLEASGTLIVRAVKRGLQLGVVGTTHHAQAMQLTQDLLPDSTTPVGVLETGLRNSNVLIHPPLVLTNWSRIESSQPFRFYREGLTEAGARLIEAVDTERRAIGSAFGLALPTLLDQLLGFYADQGMRGARLGEALGNFPQFADTPGPQSLDHRYLTDDIPFGLVPLAALARIGGVPTPVIDALVQTLAVLSGVDFIRGGRTVEEMGLAHMSHSEAAMHLGVRESATAS